MANAAQLLRLNVVELLRHPGATREVDAELAAPDLGADDERVAGDIVIALQATSSIDGIVVHGTVSTPWHGSCRRCLIDVDGVAVAAIDELFQQPPAAADATEIAGDQVDLAPIVREYVLLELPDAPLCRADCAGICPQCGADRNETPCACATIETDDRWAALDALRLDGGTDE